MPKRGSRLATTYYYWIIGCGRNNKIVTKLKYLKNQTKQKNQTPQNKQQQKADRQWDCRYEIFFE